MERTRPATGLGPGEGLTVEETAANPIAERSSEMLTAIETVRTLPTNRAVFAQTKIVHVMEGIVEVETARGAHRLAPGMALALGGGQWCRVRPTPRVRLWTVYADELFLRTQMAWFLPDRSRLHNGLHPHEWDGNPMILAPGIATLRRVEPLWRQMSILHDDTHSPETVAVCTVELLARWVGIVIPAFLAPGAKPATGEPAWNPVNGHLTVSAAVGHVGRAAQLLRERMDEPWTTTTLARAVAVSRTHLTRLFVARTGVAPMRYLTEVRLTEFTRLIEETDCTVAHAANVVGWSDPRTASTWFYRRYGITPSRYRLNPHPHRPADEACESTPTG